MTPKIWIVYTCHCRCSKALCSADIRCCRECLHTLIIIIINPKSNFCSFVITHTIENYIFFSSSMVRIFERALFCRAQSVRKMCMTEDSQWMFHKIIINLKSQTKFNTFVYHKDNLVFSRYLGILQQAFADRLVRKIASIMKASSSGPNNFMQFLYVTKATKNHLGF